tara:strand:- start:4851 stop:5912 length:1062 start_codon:yes stop_codon:yes gene_type:complete
MKTLFYWTIRNLCKVGAKFYFRKIEINGMPQIPSDGPVIYAPNHQNAFLDAILIGVFSPKPVAFFTRGDIFVQPYLWFLNALNMLPVFRAVDGFSMAAQNDKTFDLAVQTLLNDKPLMIFPEANHDYPYTLRTLSKGTARIAFATQSRSTKPVYIVPVGLNYFRRHSPRFKLIINYGKPIPLKDYSSLYKEHKGQALSAVRKEMTNVLKSEMIIPDLDANYEDTARIFSRKNENLTFKELQENRQTQINNDEVLYDGLKAVVFFLSIINFVPILLSNYLVSLFKDPVFEGSMKFGVAALFCPLWYVGLFFLLGSIWNYNISTIIIAISLALLFIRQELKRLYTDTEHVFITKW